ncbi:MAG: hypothetical protein LBK68_03555 [Candidatus Margulisbacteria bacterium]|jgi:hypothetical protein|nr:hypothetical protein [Candidatus Margulisiibacteriota bacterium]
MRDNIENLVLSRVTDTMIIESNSEYVFAITDNQALGDRIAVDIQNIFGRKAATISSIMYQVSFEKNGEEFYAEFNTIEEAEIYLSTIKARHNDYIQKLRET